MGVTWRRDECRRGGVVCIWVAGEGWVPHWCGSRDSGLWSSLLRGSLRRLLLLLLLLLLLRYLRRWLYR